MNARKSLVKALGPVLLLTACLAMSVETAAAPAQGRQAAHNRNRGPQGQEIDGFVNNEGAECPALRDHGGRLWTLAGNAHGLRPGEHVRLYGRVVDGSACAWQGTAFEILEVKTVWAGAEHTAAR